MTTGLDYIVVRRAGEGWGVFKVTTAEGLMRADLLDLANNRNIAFCRARDTAAIYSLPLMGRDGLEPVAASEVEF